MSNHFDFFMQTDIAGPTAADDGPDHQLVRSPTPNGRKLTTAEIIDHGPVIVTIVEMDKTGALALVTRAGDPDVEGASFRFEAKTPCVKRAPVHLLARMQLGAHVELAYTQAANSKGPVLSIVDVTSA